MIISEIGAFAFFTPLQPTPAELLQPPKEPAAQVVSSSENWGRRRRRPDAFYFFYLKHVQSLEVMIPDSSSHVGVSMASRVTAERSLYICIEVYDKVVTGRPAA